MKDESDYSQDEIMEILGGTKFFDIFSLFEKKRFAGHPGVLVRFRPGVKIITEGELGDCFYVLLSGNVDVVMQHAELSNLGGDGELFGEMAFFTGTQRSTSVVAADDVLVFRIDQALMKRLGCETREKIKDQCIQRMAARIDHINKRLRVRM